MASEPRVGSEALQNKHEALRAFLPRARPWSTLSLACGHFSGLLELAEPRQASTAGSLNVAGSETVSPLVEVHLQYFDPQLTVKVSGQVTALWVSWMLTRIPAEAAQAVVGNGISCITALHLVPNDRAEISLISPLDRELRRIFSLRMRALYRYGHNCTRKKALKRAHVWWIVGAP